MIEIKKVDMSGDMSENVFLVDGHVTETRYISGFTRFDSDDDQVWVSVNNFATCMRILEHRFSELPVNCGQLSLSIDFEWSEMLSEFRTSNKTYVVDFAYGKVFGG